MDELREGIGLRAYGQRDPLVEFKREAFRMFERLQDNIRHDIVHTIFHVSVVQQPRVAMSTNSPSDTKVATRNPSRKVGRNDPCPCGSGKKYKKCHGALRVRQ
jgi:preprotein translocase subunit SecA